MQNGSEVALTDTPGSTTEAKGGEAPAEAGRERGTVTRKPVIVAISRISAILDGLDGDSRGRVVRFIAEEYAEFLPAFEE